MNKPLWEKKKKALSGDPELLQFPPATWGSSCHRFPFPFPPAGKSIAGCRAAPRGPGPEMAAGWQTVGDSPCPEEPALGAQGAKEGCWRGPSEPPQNSGAQGEAAVFLASRGIWGWKRNGPQPSCISGGFLPSTFGPTSSVRPIRGDFGAGGSFWSLTCTPGKGKSQPVRTWIYASFPC